MNLTFPYPATALRLWRGLWAIGLAVSVFGATPARSASLLVERTANPVELVNTKAQRWTRSRPVTINPDVLQDLRSGNAASLTLETFDGDTYVVRLARKYHLPSGAELWSGDAADQPGSDVQLVFSDHSVSLSANIIGKPPYALRPVGANQYRLCELDLTQGEECCTLHRAPSPAGTVPGKGVKPQSLNSAAAEAEFMLVDIAILYTPAARIAAGGKAAIEAEAFKALNVANDVHDNSKTFVHLRLVALKEISFTEKSTIHQDLDALMVNGQASDILRDYGADLVSLLVARTEGANGLASTPGIFSVVKWDHAYSGLTFAHETGHSFGADHFDAESPIFPYARAYLFGSFYRTVMASDPTGGFRTRVKHYSNPDVSYKDFAGVEYVTGDRATADNARAIRQTKQRTRDNQTPTSFYARFIPQTSNPFTGPNPLPPGEGSEYSPSNHLEYLFGAIQPGPFGTTTPIPSVINLVGFPADETAVIQLDPTQRFNEKLTISRPCLLVKRGTSGSVVIGPP